MSAETTVWVSLPAGEERSEEHTSELQSLRHLVCRLLLEKKNPDDRLHAGLRSTREAPLGRGAVSDLQLRGAAALPLLRQRPDPVVHEQHRRWHPDHEGVLP